MDIRISDLLIYPVKSLPGISMAAGDVLRTGFPHDRHWAIADEAHRIITGREYPQLFHLSVTRIGDCLVLNGPGLPEFTLTIGNQDADTNDPVDLLMFNHPTTGIPMNPEVSAWISGYLGIPCTLVQLTSQAREMHAKYGGKPNDIVSYADTSPFHLVAEESLEELNSRLARPIAMDRFRPNLIIRGGTPYEEDQWKYLRIGECEFEVNERCKRCVMATIDRESLQKEEQQEPLRTLSGYRVGPAGGVTFGVNLIPRKLGKIRVGEKIEVLN